VIREIQKGSTVIDQFPVFEDDGYTKKTGLGPANFSATVFLNAAILPVGVTVDEIGSSGEYSVGFTAGFNGLYEVQVYNDFNDEIWHAQYVSVDELTNALAEVARDQALKIDEAAVDPAPAGGSLYDQLVNKDSSQTYDPSTDSLEAISDAMSSSTGSINSILVSMQVDLARVLGLLHRNSMLDKQEYDGQSHLTFARLRVFDSEVNVPATPDGNETVGLLHEYEIETEYDGLNVVKKFTLKQVL